MLYKELREKKQMMQRQFAAAYSNEIYLYNLRNITIIKREDYGK
jgi:hypothetical protein